MFKDFRSEINCPPNFERRVREKMLGFPSILGRRGTSQMAFHDKGKRKES